MSIAMLRIAAVTVAACGAVLGVTSEAGAQPRGGGAPAPTPREAASLDLAGYWVAVVNEDWKFRMVLPDKGVYAGIPLNAEGRRVADTWDPALDTAGGEQCRGYGAASIMRVPARLHIAWDDPDTLRIDVDAGTQTRLLEFGSVGEVLEPSWQGVSRAVWQPPATVAAPGTGGTLKVVTTGMKPGYLRKNGVPYSAEAVLTEYYNSVVAPNGDSWLVVTSVVEDPKYLSRPYVSSSHFKRLPNDAGWRPTPCSAT